MVEEAAGAVDERGVEDLGGGALFNDLAAFEDNDAMGDAAGEGHFVGDDDHRHAFLGELLHHVEDLADRFGVEGGGGLVEQHDLGFHCQSAGDGDALLLAAGEVGGVAGGLVGEADLVQQGHGAGLGVAAGQAQHCDGAAHDVGQRSAVGEQLEALEHHAHALAHRAHATRSRAGRGMPSRRISPPSSDSNPLVQRSSVDLPEPEGPIRQITSPRLTSIDTPSKATKLPNSLRASW